MPRDWATAPEPDGPWFISWVAYTALRAQVEQLRDEVHRLTVDRDHWYMAANYTPEQIAEMRRRATKGLDENGEWQWPDSLNETK